MDVADFLAALPPFDGLDADDLARLTAVARPTAFVRGSVIVGEGDRPERLWVLCSGSVEVLHRGRLVDLLGPGDMVGHVPLLSHLPAAMTARAAEDCVCLGMPDPRPLVTRPDRLHFAAPAPLGERLVRDGTLSGAHRPLTRVMRPPVWVHESDRVRDVAAAIEAAGHSCALVRGGDRMGIVTDRDFRHRVGTGEVGIDDPVRALATVPALTVAEEATQATAFVRMVEHAVHHLVVVDAEGEPTGVVRAVDLASAQVRDPLVVRSAIESAEDVDALAVAAALLPATIVELHDSRVPGSLVGALTAAVVDAVVRRVIDLRDQPGVAPVSHSWVLLGSQARREPLPYSDIDTALVWADSPGGADAGPGLRALAELILADLEACGLRRCPDGANATNPLFSRSRAGWNAANTRWLDEPSRAGALLLSAMVADSRPGTGIALGHAMTDAIRARTRSTRFLRAFLQEAVALRPPTGFVRDFVVEHGGEHRGQLDLKRGGLKPIVNLARWVAIATGDPGGTTVQRLERAVEAALLTRDEADTLIGAFTGIYDMLIGHEVRAIRRGAVPSTYIAPRDMDTLTRRHLRESFRALGTIQTRVEHEWLAWSVG